MPQTEAQIRAKKRWIENNKKFNNDLHNIYSKLYYEQHREQRLNYAKEYYREKKKKPEIVDVTETIEPDIK